MMGQGEIVNNDEKKNEQENMQDIDEDTKRMENEDDVAAMFGDFSDEEPLQDKSKEPTEVRLRTPTRAPGVKRYNMSTPDGMNDDEDIGPRSSKGPRM